MFKSGLESQQIRNSTLCLQITLKLTGLYYVLFSFITFQVEIIVHFNVTFICLFKIFIRFVINDICKYYCYSINLLFYVLIFTNLIIFHCTILWHKFSNFPILFVNQYSFLIIRIHIHTYVRTYNYTRRST